MKEDKVKSLKQLKKKERKNNLFFLFKEKRNN